MGKITVSIAVTSLENVGLDTTTLMALVEPVGVPTLSVNTIESLTVLGMLVVRVHFSVLRVQFHPFVGSTTAVAVRPWGSVIDSVADGSIEVSVLVLVTSMVTWSTCRSASQAEDSG